MASEGVQVQRQGPVLVVTINRPAQRNALDRAAFDPALFFDTDGRAYIATAIGSDGTVSVAQPGQQGLQQVGAIQLANFPNPSGLNSIGKNLFLSTGSSGDAITGTPGGSEGIGPLQQGMLEESNVNVVEEFIQMVLTQRAYEANSKVVRAADEMFQNLNNLTR